MPPLWATAGKTQTIRPSASWPPHEWLSTHTHHQQWLHRRLRFVCYLSPMRSLSEPFFEVGKADCLNSFPLPRARFEAGVDCRSSPICHRQLHHFWWCFHHFSAIFRLLAELHVLPPISPSPLPRLSIPTRAESWFPTVAIFWQWAWRPCHACLHVLASALLESTVCCPHLCPTLLVPWPCLWPNL